MEDFIEGYIWQDMKDEVDAWIKEVTDILSDPDGPKDIETISTMRGIVKACKNFKMMPEVLKDNMEEDIRHERSDKARKNWR